MQKQAAAAMSGALWFYVDSAGQQKGPVPEAVLLKMAEKGLGGVSAATLVWHSEMTEWQAVHLVEPFASRMAFQVKQWCYLDHEHQQRGPVLSKLLIHKLMQGEIDGLTMVYSTGMAEWQKVSEVAELTAELRKEAQHEEALEAAKQASEAQAVQAFPGGDDDEAVAQASRAYFEQAKEKSFEADDGLRYQWDDAEQDWVVAEDVDGDAAASGATVEISDTAGAAQAKRRRADESDSGGEDDAASDDDDPASGAPADSGTVPVKEKKKRKKRKKTKAPATWVYVSGLPEDVTADELKLHFSKVGLLALSPYDQQPRIKIYRRDGSDRCKGDCTLCYNSEESVKLAVEILDGGYLRPGVQIAVSRATFETAKKDDGVGAGAGAGARTGAEPEAAGTATGPRKPRLTAAQIKVARNAAKQALLWNEDDDIGVGKAAALRITVLEGMFRPAQLEAQPTLVEELEQDVASECERFGAVEKITVFTKSALGVVVVKFATAFAAQECVRVMNGRFFAGEQLRCFFWDGVTNYAAVTTEAIEEDERREAARLDEFGDWLEKEQEQLPEEFQLRTE